MEPSFNRLNTYRVLLRRSERMWLILLIALPALCPLVAANSKTSQLLAVSYPGGQHAPYYERTLAGLGYSMNDIVNFFIEYAKAAETSGDEFLVIYPEESNAVSSRFSEFPASTLFLPVPADATQDLWMRDYPLVTPDRTVKFGYRPEYLSEADQNFVDCHFIRLLKYIGAYEKVSYSQIALDGGNIVDTTGKAIATRRTIKENPGFTEADIKDEIELKLGRRLCWIMDPGPADTTGHADGLVSFLNENTLILLKDNDEEFYQQNRNDILACFPDLNVVAIPSQRRQVKETEFASAVGGYVNGLMTNNAIYLPQFDQPGKPYSTEDAEALQLVTGLVGSEKKVVTVNTGRLSPMGGSVRCMTWQMNSDTAVANALRQAAGGQIPAAAVDDGVCSNDASYSGTGY